MTNKFHKILTLVSFSGIIFITGCVGGGYGNGANANNGGYGNNGPYSNNGAYGNNGPYPNNGAGTGGAANNSLGMIQSAVINAIIQSMAGSVLNGQIGSQLTPVDQNFRLKQLGTLVQSGAVSQAQQWVNPQTGNTIALNPVGQLSINPQTQQKCQQLEENLITKSGERIRENRLACVDSQTGKWNLVQ